MKSKAAQVLLKLHKGDHVIEMCGNILTYYLIS